MRKITWGVLLTTFGLASIAGDSSGNYQTSLKQAQKINNQQTSKKKEELNIKVNFEIPKEKLKDTQANEFKDLTENYEYVFAAIADNFDKAPFDYLNLTFTDVNDNLVLLDGKHKQEFNRSLPQIIDVIESGQKFWEHPKLIKPRFDFKIPNDVSSLESRRRSLDRDNMIDIYPIKEHKRTFDFKIQFMPTKYWVTSSLNIDLLGEQSNTWEIKPKGRNLELTFFRTPVTYMYKSDITHMLETPSIEILHQQIGMHSSFYAAKDWQKQLSQGVYKDYNDAFDGFKVIMKKAAYSDEIFVHALHGLFFEDYTKKHPELGIPLDNLQDKLGRNNKNTRYFREKIRSKGVKKSLDIYLNNPENFIKLEPGLQ